MRSTHGCQRLASRSCLLRTTTALVTARNLLFYVYHVSCTVLASATHSELPHTLGDSERCDSGTMLCDDARTLTEISHMMRVYRR